MNTPHEQERRPWNRRYWFLKGLKVAVMIIFFVGVFSWVFMLLWNCLVPGIFGLQPLNYWQAMGLLILSRIIFGGRGGWGHGHHHWKHRMRGRWESMTPEEREKFRAAMRDKWCWRDEQR
jgi:Ca2+/H+ antiporter, TMEM165/GDT1 family